MWRFDKTRIAPIVAPLSQSGQVGLLLLCSFGTPCRYVSLISKTDANVPLTKLRLSWQPRSHHARGALPTRTEKLADQADSPIAIYGWRCPIHRRSTAPPRACD